jgi:hypothetical protein
MMDIFLREGASSPSDIILRDPTVADSGSSFSASVAEEAPAPVQCATGVAALPVAPPAPVAVGEVIREWWGPFVPIEFRPPVTAQAAASVAETAPAPTQGGTAGVAAGASAAQRARVPRVVARAGVSLTRLHEMEFMRLLLLEAA